MPESLPAALVPGEVEGVWTDENGRAEVEDGEDVDRVGKLLTAVAARREVSTECAARIWEKVKRQR